MLTSITLQNFKSFGEEQTIPLEPITVLVGPNNSGKSNLVSLARFIRNAAMGGAESAFKEEGGVRSVFHRPVARGGSMRIGWKVDDGTDTEGSYSIDLAPTSPTLVATPEREHFDLPRLAKDWAGSTGVPFSKLQSVVTGGPLTPPYGDAFRGIGLPLVTSREIKLALSALRQDAEVVPEPVLAADGSGMAPVLALWRGANLDQAAQLDAFIHKCLPEIAHVIVKPGPVPGENRLWVQQTDGEQFDAAHISDGVLSFIALAMHAIDAEPGALLFIEEPEQSIHPRRIHDLVELFRTIVYERKCQLVVVTHSPVLLHEFRDEPEAILLFRRSETGTRVNALTHFPDLIEALTTRKADPGTMLVDGFLNDPT